MGLESDGKVHISMNPAIFYTVLTAVALGGLGGGLTLGPRMDEQAVLSCFDNSERALNVAVQHGEELNRLEELLIERTRSRYSQDDAARDGRQQSIRDDNQDRRIQLLESYHD